MNNLSFIKLILLTLLLIAKPILAEQKTLLIFGDSLSAAYNLPAEQGWAHLLQQKITQQQLPWRVVNLSISGETSSGGLLRFDKALALYSPSLVILELGANDGLRGQSLKAMSHNLRSMITQSQAIKAEVLLAGMFIPPNYGKRYTQAFHQVFVQLSQEHQTAFIPFILDDIANNPNLLLNDDLHPNTEGQKQLLINVWKYLKPLL
ncbi:MAG: arylesterase [Pseudomonadales bacterium]|nr:arylesterase [Pseudomonadales bacterium]